VPPDKTVYHAGVPVSLEGQASAFGPEGQNAIDGIDPQRGIAVREGLLIYLYFNRNSAAKVLWI